MNKTRERCFLLAATCLSAIGCVESQSTGQVAPFQDRKVDACLSIIVDMSGSFRESWDDRAYKLFLDLSDRFFTENMGGESKLVIGQISANEQVLLFEGRPEDLRKRFNSPEEFNQFLLDRSDANGSYVFEATRKAVEHLGAVSGVTEETRLLTVVLSDMQDSQGDKRSLDRMAASLRQYQELGGALALYFVSESEIPRWRAIVNDAGFAPDHVMIENELAASPRLPQFD